MSDEFFNQFLDHTADNEAQTPKESAPAQEPVYAEPAVAPQPSPWVNAYEAPQPAQSFGTDADPYVGRSSVGAPHTGYSAATGSPNTYVDADGFYHRSFTEHRPAPSAPVRRHAAPEKKEEANFSKGAVAILLIVCILFAGAAGFGGGYLAMKQSENKYETVVNANKDGTGANMNINIDPDSEDYESVSGQLVIHKVAVQDSVASGSDLVDKDTDEITRAVADSVVEITTEVVQTSGYYGQYISTGAGSGVIISDDGYIITNNHVIEDASNITVTLRSGESYDAKLIGTDADEDIALLKIDASGLTVAVFGDSSTLEVGDKSVIIGNPLGTLGGSVTEGIVSALDRSIVIDGKTMHLMQTDAAINPGNSGGGMFNGQGELVGIVVAKSGGTSSGSTIDNIGFVIPINNVLNILGDLKEYGYVRGKADTGMSFVDITNQMYAWYYYNSSSTGVFISSVERGSNAAEAGFQAGDRVISVDGKAVSSASDLSAIISSHSVGDTITFELERSGRTGTIDLTLEEYVPSTHR